MLYFKRKIGIVLILVPIIFTHINAQNLVPNPSFEEIKKCPNAWNDGNAKRILKYWIIPNQGTTDYYSGACNKMPMYSTPKNFMGNTYPVEGKAYVGIIAGSNDRTKYVKQGDSKEYVQVKLLNPLVAGKIYCVKFYVYHATKSISTVSQIGLYLSVNRVKEKHRNRINYMPQVVSNNLLNKTHDDWEEVCGDYLAQGGEQYITIGSFLTATEETFQVLPKYRGKERRHSVNEQYAYYYLDYVSVTELKEGEGCGCKKEEAIEVKKDSVIKIETKATASFIPGKTIVLPDVTFEVNKWELSSDVKPLLDSLVAYLQANAQYTLQINGYTDNSGSEKVNKELSEHRAKAVADYIVLKGVEPMRLRYRGYGSNNPVSDNTTKEGKAKNRRVEIDIVR